MKIQIMNLISGHDYVYYITETVLLEEALFSEMPENSEDVEETFEEEQAYIRSNFAEIWIYQILNK